MAGRNPKRVHISPDLMSDILKKDNLKEAEKLFDNIDSKLDQVSKLLEKVPDNAVVRPKRSWLNIFGIE